MTLSECNENSAWNCAEMSSRALRSMTNCSRVNVLSVDFNIKCQQKLHVLLTQREDLSSAIDDLIVDISKGDKFMKVYKQMKMYNDNELNPVLRGQK